MSQKDQQVKTVTEGLAVGVLAQGVEAVTSRRQTFQFAFDAAWRDWAPAGRFPSIAGTFPSDHIVVGLARSEGRRFTTTAWRHSGPWYEPVRCEGYETWTVEDCLEHISDGQVTSAEHWTQLGALFVAHLKEDEVRRAAQHVTPRSPAYQSGRRPAARSMSVQRSGLPRAPLQLIVDQNARVTTSSLTDVVDQW
jgi:hypothetical protein